MYLQGLRFVAVVTGTKSHGTTSSDALATVADGDPSDEEDPDDGDSDRLGDGFGSILFLPSDEEGDEEPLSGMMTPAAQELLLQRLSAGAEAYPNEYCPHVSS